MKVKTVVCLDPNIKLIEAHRIIECYRSGEKILIDLIMKGIPFDRRRHYVAGAGKITALHADQFFCLDCGLIRSLGERKVGRSGREVLLFCADCELQLVQVWAIDRNTAASLGHWEQGRLRYSVSQWISYFNIA